MTLKITYSHKKIFFPLPKLLMYKEMALPPFAITSWAVTKLKLNKLETTVFIVSFVHFENPFFFLVKIFELQTIR